MSTTTIRLDDALKARVAALAQRSGKTAHSLILDAIAQSVERAELSHDFHRVADDRWATVLATGKTVPWDDMRSYLAARSSGGKPRKPKARKLAR